MYSIAKSRLIDHLRKEKRLRNWQVSVDFLPERPAEQPFGPGGDRLQKALDGLPESQREAFTLLKIDGLSTEEAAERAGVSLSALKVRAHRAYKALRRAIASDLD